MEKKRIITADEAIALLPDKDEIHTFRNTGIGLFGCDLSREEMLEALKKADVIELAGETARSMDHGLAVYASDIKMQSEVLFVETDMDKLNAFDPIDDVNVVSCKI